MVDTDFLSRFVWLEELELQVRREIVKEQVQIGLPWGLQAWIDAWRPHTMEELKQRIQEYQLKQQKEGMEWKFTTTSQTQTKEGWNGQPSRRTESKSTSRREVTC